MTGYPLFGSLETDTAQGYIICLMKISLIEARRGRQDFHACLSPAELDLEHLPLRGDLRVQVHLQEQPDGWLLLLELSCTLTRTCDRCCAPVEQQLCLRDQVWAFLADSLPEGMIDEDLHLLEPEQEELDLSQDLRDLVVLVSTEHFLCSDDCRGLCPQCGCDLNRASCDCPEPIAPSPFAALAALKAKKKTDE